MEETVLKNIMQKYNFDLSSILIFILFNNTTSYMFLKFFNKSDVMNK